MLKNIKAVLLDLDGTVYRGKEVIEGVPQAIREVRKLGIRVFFISNASMRTRKEQIEKLQNMGIPCKLNDVYNTAYATAEYIKKNYPRAKVYVISEGGLRKEIELAGIKTTANEKDGEHADIVATGLDTKINLKKLTTALRAIINDAVFIASNLDRIYPTEKGVLPGTGTIAAFIEYGTRKKPIVIGKPEPHLIKAVLANAKLKKKEVLFIGDNYETDLKAAKVMNIKCALVLTGVTKKSQIAQLSKKDRPEFVLNSAAEMRKILS